MAGWWHPGSYQINVFLDGAYGYAAGDIDSFSFTTTQKYDRNFLALNLNANTVG
jgi:hypothetical protein